MQVVQICKHNVMSAPGGEAAQHRGAVQGVTIQALGDSRASTETDGLCHFNQTHSADVPRQVQRDPEDGSGPLQGQVNHQQMWQLKREWVHVSVPRVRQDGATQDSPDDQI